MPRGHIRTAHAIAVLLLKARTEDPAASAAILGQANGDFSMACRASRQQHDGDTRTGEEQHDADRKGQRRECRPTRGNRLLFLGRLLLDRAVRDPSIAVKR